MRTRQRQQVISSTRHLFFSPPPPLLWGFFFLCFAVGFTVSFPVLVYAVVGVWTKRDQSTVRQAMKRDMILAENHLTKAQHDCILSQ